ncbi:DUF559 domain-containing protein [Gordonia sp. Z-3]|uniref:endonuclease domain-containing protein n=1 Tax=unclassified Gordonia (in: high G+C Gram-positive bacteria) TaxID=2657482 RepID=UPI000C3ABD6B|nr:MULTISPECIES: DUF559 domain-containing protein [unclassified Gordonia (in: high G+C Gram-positive bacteria)]MAU84484.1 hypothetical protein [Gordonia sp. (in: high G+C Gram-positive bacteria)]MED5802084.1 DUF559 domain-containing protein [Gordonia sp. Z-3]
MTFEHQATPRTISRKDALTDLGLTPEQFAAEFTVLRGNNHLHRGQLMTAQQRIITVVDQAHGDPVIAGESALIMYGSRWHDDDFTIELIRGTSASGRPARGTVTRRLDLPPSEIVEIQGRKVTSPLRTAFDLGRQRSRMQAIGDLDALAAVVPLDLDELMAFAVKHKRSRYVRVLRELIPLIDGRAESPRESALRLFMHDVGLPKPDLQVEVRDESGKVIARCDLAYEAAKIAIEYDGEAYHSTPEQLAHDGVRTVALDRLEWKVIRVTAKRLRSEPFAVVEEVWDALRARGFYFC